MTRIDDIMDRLIDIASTPIRAAGYPARPPRPRGPPLEGAGMSTYATRLQEVADHFFFGNEWRAFIQNCTLETAEKAQREVYLAGLTVDDDSEFAEPIDDMWLKTSSRLNSLKKEAAK